MWEETITFVESKMSYLSEEPKAQPYGLLPKKQAETTPWENLCVALLDCVKFLPKGTTTAVL